MTNRKNSSLTAHWILTLLFTTTSLCNLFIWPNEHTFKNLGIFFKTTKRKIVHRSKITCSSNKRKPNVTDKHLGHDVQKNINQYAKIIISKSNHQAKQPISTTFHQQRPKSSHIPKKSNS